MYRRAVRARKYPHDTQSFFGLGPQRSKHVFPPPIKERLIVSQREYLEYKRQTSRIIERAKYQPADWKTTHTLRGEEMKLAALVKDNDVSGNRKSLEKEAFEIEEPEQGEELEDVNFASSVLPPGTFVESRRSLILAHGVVIGEHVVSRRRKMTTIMSSGEVWYPGQYDVLFSFPNFIPTELVERCGSEETTSSPSQINARVEVLRLLRKMERKTEVMLNVISMKSAVIYDKVKSPDPEAWSTTTLREAVDLITPQPEELTQFAVHKYLISNPLYFVADQNYETSRIIHVRPQAHVDNINTIKEWTRGKQEPIESFTAKVRKLMRKYRKIQQNFRSDEPSYKPAAHVWSKDDRTILKFLHNSLRQTRSNQSDPYSLGVSCILKKINPERLDGSSDVYDILVNIGALAPWQDLTTLDSMLARDTEPEATSIWTKKQEDLAMRGFASMKSSRADTSLGPEDFHKTDPLEIVRHDFGDLPVYVIDDVDAQELDDGISVERIPSEPDNFWLHVHVADPASLIPPTNVLTQEAYKRTVSLYLSHRTWPIFPKGVMSHPTLGLSLGRKTQDSPLRVITFSAKVDNKGQLLDYKVRAGLINNVNVITYEHVNKVIGHSDSDKWYPFGCRLHPTLKSANLTDSHAQDLRDILKIAGHLMEKRYRDEVIIPGRNVLSLRPIIRPPPEIDGPLYEPLICKGFPTFEYSVVEASAEDSGARFLVAESMKLACRVASRFCIDHNVPVARRVADPLSLYASVDRQQVLDMRTPNCFVPFQFLIDKMAVPSMSSYAMEPRGHYTLGTVDGEGYTRATSPLRRYMDLMVHWQIHHALLGSKAPKVRPPYNADEFWEVVKTATSREKSARHIERFHARFGQLMFIKRWAQDHGGFDCLDGPLGNIKVYTLNAIGANARNGVLQVQVYCPGLALLGMLDHLPNQNIVPGTPVDVKIREIVLGTRPQVYFSLKYS